MAAAELISLYNTLFYVSAVVSALGLVLAVFFFFFFDIRTVYALMTGKAKAETIRRMTEQNSRTGNLRAGAVSTGYTGPTGQTGETKGPIILNPATAEAADSAETSVLQPDDEEQTTFLGHDSTNPGETSVRTNVPAGFRFELTENTLVIHTNEII